VGREGVGGLNSLGILKRMGVLSGRLGLLPIDVKTGNKEPATPLFSNFLSQFMGSVSFKKLESS